MKKDMTDEEKAECAYHWGRFHASLLSNGPIYEIPDKYKMTLEEISEWIETMTNALQSTAITFEEAAEALQRLGRAMNGIEIKRIEIENQQMHSV